MLRRLTFAALGGMLALACAAATPAAGPVDAARLMDAKPAPTLADYALFKDAAAQVPNAGVTPYALNTPLFSDYAEKDRFVFLPSGVKAAWRDVGVLDLPVGATLVKSFSYPADLRHPDAKVRRIETRLLIHRAEGWVPLTYVWNAEGTEAVLKRAGARMNLAFTDAHGQPVSFSYAVPNVNQCKECHALNGVLTPIGPKARNLDGAFTYASGAENQLAHWTRTGILADAPATRSAAPTAHWTDASAPVAARARAYLDANCGHCHNAGGIANNSGLFLDWEQTDPVKRGIGKRPVAAGRGAGELDFDVVPGHPEQSILVHRMESREPGVMMPELGRNLVHEEGLEVVRAYIKSLEPAKGA